MSSSNAGVMGLVVNLKRMQSEQLQKMIERNKLSPMSLKNSPDEENLFSRMAIAEFCPMISSSVLEETLVFVPSSEKSCNNNNQMRDSQRKAVNKVARIKAEESWDLYENWMETTPVLTEVISNPTSTLGSPGLKAVAPFAPEKMKENDVQEEQCEQVNVVSMTPQDPMLPEPDVSLVINTHTCFATEAYSGQELEESSLTQQLSDISQVNTESPTVDLELQIGKPVSEEKPKEPLINGSGQNCNRETTRMICPAEVSSCPTGASNVVAAEHDVLMEAVESCNRSSNSSQVSSCPKISDQSASISDTSCSSPKEMLPGNSGSASLPTIGPDLISSSAQSISESSTLQANPYSYSAQQLVPSSRVLPSPQTVEHPTAAKPSPDLSALPALGCFMKFPNSQFNFWNAVHCRFCGFPKSSPDELEAHIAWDHWNWVPFQCCYCEGVFRPTQYTLRLHLQEVHPNQPHKIICDIDDQKAMSLREEVRSAVARMIQQQVEVVRVQKLAGQSGTGILPVPLASPAPPPSVVLPPTQLAPTPAPTELMTECAARPKQHIEEVQTPPETQHAIREAHQQPTPSIPSKAGQSPIDKRQKKLKSSPPELKLTAENGEIQCQECPAVIESRQQHIHGHVYEHLYQNGLGYRYICCHCGYGCIRKFQFYAHSKDVHTLEPQKLKDRSQELSDTFYAMKSACFPSFKLETSGSLCNLCSSAVQHQRKNEHIYRYHLKKPTTKCAYCDFVIHYGGKAKGKLKSHTYLIHPGRSPKTESLIHLYKEEVQVLRAHCFGDKSVVRQSLDNPMDQTSPTSGDLNDFLPGPADSIYSGFGADQLMDFPSSPNSAAMEVECRFDNGYAAKVDHDIEAEENVVVIG